MLHEFRDRKIPNDILRPEDEDWLTLHGFVYLTTQGYALSEKGMETLNSHPEDLVRVQYPLMSKGRVGSYNKVITTMSKEASTALLSAMVCKNFFSKIPTSNTRVFIQHLLDENSHHKWGEELIRKVIAKLNTSIDFFNSKKIDVNV